MKSRIVFLLLVFTTSLYAVPFDYLEPLKVDRNPDAWIYYQPGTTEIVSESFDHRKGDTPQLILKTRLTSARTLYYVFFYPGPSTDPGFIIDLDDNPDNGTFAMVPGEHLYLPGNGSVYVSQRFNQRYAQKRKHRVEKDGLSEVPQPFYGINISTVTKASVTLFSDFEMTSVLANLPKEYPVTIFLEKNGKFLIQTEFGLVGWINVAEGYLEGVTFEEIFYCGD